MKKVLLIILLLLSRATVAERDESVEALKARAATAQGKQQVELYTKIAESQLQAADQAYTAGNVPQAQAALSDVVEYGVKAANSSAQTGKRMKPTEIALRKMAVRLEDIRKTLNVDDRTPVADGVAKLEQARTELLNRMFRK